MKHSMFVLIMFMSLNINAQQKKVLIKDSLGIKSFSKYKKPINIFEEEALLKTTIENELNSIVALYLNQPNTQPTWIKIKASADDLLYKYYRSGQLYGYQKEQAYFIKMGMETINTKDIVDKKIILMAGIAIRKPAEFHLITVTKYCNY